MGRDRTGTAQGRLPVRTLVPSGPGHQQVACPRFRVVKAAVPCDLGVMDNFLVQATI